MDASELVPGEEYIYLGKDGRTGPLRFEGVREGDGSTSSTSSAPGWGK